MPLRLFPAANAPPANATATTPPNAHHGFACNQFRIDVPGVQIPGHWTPESPQEGASKGPGYVKSVLGFGFVSTGFNGVTWGAPEVPVELDPF